MRKARPVLPAQPERTEPTEPPEATGATGFVISQAETVLAAVVAESEATAVPEDMAAAVVADSVASESASVFWSAQEPAVLERRRRAG